MPYGITQCYLPPDRGGIPQPKLALGLATPEGCKVEVTGTVYTLSRERSPASELDVEFM